MMVNKKEQAEQRAKDKERKAKLNELPLNELTLDDLKYLISQIEPREYEKKYSNFLIGEVYLCDGVGLYNLIERLRDIWDELENFPDTECRLDGSDLDIFETRYENDKEYKARLLEIYKKHRKTTSPEFQKYLELKRKFE